MISWTRRSRLQIGSICNAQASDPAQIGAAAQCKHTWLALEACLGYSTLTATCQVTDHWYQSKAALVSLESATQTPGRNIDW